MRSSPLAFHCSSRSTRSRSTRPTRSANRAIAQRGHDHPHVLGQQREEPHHVLGLAGEALPQLGILRRDPDRAGVEVADAHHDAAEGDQRRRRGADLLGTQQRGDDDVAARPHPAVGLVLWHPEPGQWTIEFWLAMHSNREKALHLVKAGSQVFLIGTAENQVEYLTAVNDENAAEIVRSVSQTDPPHKDFKQLLSRFQRVGKAE